jgi:hypothetical protein
MWVPNSFFPKIPMTNTLAKFGALLGAGSVLFAALAPALAAPPPDVFKDSDGNVYIHGTTAANLGTNATASTSEDLVRRVQAGYCGEIRISPSSSLPTIGSSWTINGTTRARTSLPSITDPDLVPTCRNAAWSPALPPAITAAGGFVDNSVSGRDRVFVLGFSSGVSQEVTFTDVNASQRLRANACGFVRISNTAANPVPDSLTIGNTIYTPASLTVAAPPLCRREGSSYVQYTPESWN